MGTKTIGIREDVYRRLRSRKREDESFTDLVDRLLDESIPEWRDGFGSLDLTETAELERIVDGSRSDLSDGLDRRQTDSLDLVSGTDAASPTDRDETE